MPGGRPPPMRRSVPLPSLPQQPMGAGGVQLPMPPPQPSGAPMRRGPGKTAADGVREGWGGPKAQRYVRLTLAEYGTTCWLCGLPGANSADHIVPISQGGAVYDLANL